MRSWTRPGRPRPTIDGLAAGLRSAGDMNGDDDVCAAEVALGSRLLYRLLGMGTPTKSVPIRDRHDVWTLSPVVSAVQAKSLADPMYVRVVDRALGAMLPAAPPQTRPN